MPDTESKLRDILSAIEKVRKSLNGTQSHAVDYVWSQIGMAVTNLKKIEKEVEETIRDVRDTGA